MNMEVVKKMKRFMKMSFLALVIAALASDTSAEDEFKISKIEVICK